MLTPASAPHRRSSHRDTAGPLGEWSLARTAPGAIATPSDLGHAVSQWTAAPVPGTVAQALRTAGQWSLDHPEDLDASDWWYRCRFEMDPGDADAPARLRFQGLATLAEVWLNGRPILTADNMFQEYIVDAAGLLRPSNELVMCFRSLTAALARKRARPRWKTKLVSHQQLRWFRTTLLGRMPGWSPRVAPVGPWRAVLLETRAASAITDVTVYPSLDGADGIVDASCTVSSDSGGEVSGEAWVGDASAPLMGEWEDGGYRLTGQVRIEGASLWWPHTHGAPHVYPCRLKVVTKGGLIEHECDPVGFRHVEVRNDGGAFGLEINGRPVFCRGACWTIGDIVSLTAPLADLSRDLTRMRDAGANMIRVGGTMIYEDDVFYRLCDELGLLVWQDFMFASMDYPVDDETFMDAVATEATQQLQRLRRHPSVAVYCGSSEVEQQAAMLGMPRETWGHRLFGELLPALCDRWHANAAYVPSTPSGGALPFHVGTGLAHYYGVGAYRRPLSDVRQADVKFSPECLGFANVPEPAMVDRLMEGDVPVTHDPRWKRGTPRDAGAGWDFDDVRDHYLSLMFGVDPARLRACDPSRYLELSRVTSGAVMAQVFSEWRSGHGRCRGGLVWFLKDLQAGAGWGILDSDGVPKACYYFLRRTWQPQAVVITDEGLDGLHIHVINESVHALVATLELTLLRDGRVATARARTRCQVEANGRATFASDELLGGFYDVAYAYRFGPPAHSVVAATLSSESGSVLSEAFWFPDLSAVVNGRPHPPASVHAVARARRSHVYDVTLGSDTFLYGARVDVRGFVPDDNYFCVLPGRERSVRLRAVSTEPSGPPALDGYVEALNLPEPVRIEIRRD